MSTRKVPFSRPSIGEDEIAEVADTLRSGWLTTGPKTARFEQDFARFVGAPHALGTGGCTQALHLALTTLGVRAGDEVVTSTFTFAATANVIVHCGATPVFADIDLATLGVDLADLERRITPKTRAVIAVHYAGRALPIEKIEALCRARGLALVEDAAHAVGTVRGGRAVGSWGDASAFSFYANKNLTTAEGGMLTTSSEDLAARARVLRLQGMTRDVYRRSADGRPSWRYDIVAPGFKYPMSDLQAAIGIHQLRRFPEMQAKRRHLAARYSEALSRVASVALPAPPDPGDEHAWHLYVIRVLPGAALTRDALFAALAERGVECSVHFQPLHLHPYYRDTFGFRAGDFPVAERAVDEVLSLPLFADMTDDDLDHVVASLRELLGSASP